MKTIEIIYMDGETEIIERSTDVPDEDAPRELYMHDLRAQMLTRDNEADYTARIKPEEVTE